MAKEIKSTNDLIRERNAESLMQEDLQKMLKVKSPVPGGFVEVSLEEFKGQYSEGVEYPIPLEWIDYEDRSFFMRQDDERLFEGEKTREIEESIKSIGQKEACKG